MTNFTFADNVNTKLINGTRLRNANSDFTLINEDIGRNILDCHLARLLAVDRIENCRNELNRETITFKFLDKI